MLKSSSGAAALLCVTLLRPCPTAHRASLAKAPGGQDATFAVGSDANGSVPRPGGPGRRRGDRRRRFHDVFAAWGRNLRRPVHTDGSLDAFNPGLAFSGYAGGTPSVQAVAVQADGKILAAGIFTVLNQPGGGGVVRLNADGSLDTTFNVGTGGRR